MLQARVARSAVILFLGSILVASTPVLASYAPLQDVQAWVDGTTVHFKVYDPNLGVEKEDTWRSSSVVTKLLTLEGIVVWETDVKVGVAVYDPSREGWKTYIQNANDYGGSWLVKDGVVRNHKRCILIYDAVDGNWKPQITGPYDDEGVTNAGVFAVTRYNSEKEWWIIEYHTYDPGLHSWIGSSSLFPNPSYDDNVVEELIIDDGGTVSWLWKGSSYSRGYDRETKVWYDGPTLALASFAAPSLTTGPLWFTDMSLGATSWHYDFGDGIKSNLRSPFHTYATLGEYLVTQTVAGLEGNHIKTHTVMVKNLYTITASAGENGTISPSGVTSVWQGSSMSFQMIPDSGYFVSDVIVDGKSIGPVTEYTFTNLAASHTISVSFGINLESFETGDLSGYPWACSGPEAWVVQDTIAYQGTYAAQAPTSLEGNQSSSLSVRLRVEVAMNISFMFMVSSEKDYDFLIFKIDGVEQGRWSGETGWAQVSYPVTVGKHTFTWTYSKDSEVSKGSDMAWVDMIIFPKAEPFPGDDDRGEGNFYLIPNKKGAVVVIFLDE